MVVPSAVSVDEGAGWSQRFRRTRSRPDTRAHYARPRSHGARILLEPTDFPYGECQYHAEDPFGHRRTFTETLAGVAPEAWGGVTVDP
jgi:uncharacterized glyoxalase superfamily protein PhnB